jgi:hypothetical protein
VIKAVLLLYLVAENNMKFHYSRAKLLYFVIIIIDISINKVNATIFKK